MTALWVRETYSAAVDLSRVLCGGIPSPSSPVVETERGVCLLYRTEHLVEQGATEVYNATYRALQGQARVSHLGVPQCRRACRGGQRLCRYWLWVSSRICRRHHRRSSHNRGVPSALSFRSSGLGLLACSPSRRLERSCHTASDLGANSRIALWLKSAFFDAVRQLGLQVPFL